MIGINETWTLEARTLPKLFELIKAEADNYPGCPEGYFYTTINDLQIRRPLRDDDNWKAIITAVVF